jgi:hypothetical protein
MTPLLPTPLLVLAGLVAFTFVLPRTNRPTSTAHLVAEAFAVGILTCAGFAAAWAALWLVEQRW